ncbi:MAG: PHP domain-containing protein [Pseudoflavonifractor sp.]
MFLADYHSHSLCSPDSRAPLADMVAAAAALGLDEFCITDHCDLLDGQGARADGFDWALNLAQYAAVCRDHQGLPRLKFGIELGNAAACPEDAREILRQPALDFVLGSVHNGTAALGSADFYYLDYDKPADCYTALDDYFTALEDLVALPDCYDVLGHLIYPLRYMNARAPEPITLDRYRQRMDALMLQIIGDGHGMELNTWCGRTIADWKPIFMRYHELGGEIITMGSDAHAPENLAKGLPEASLLLQSCGFRYLTTYENRQPGFVKL